MTCAATIGDDALIGDGRTATTRATRSGSMPGPATLFDAFAAFALAAGLPLLPGLHPRMAREHRGPAAAPGLEPPGFFGLRYNVRTPVSVLLARLVYGAILGAFYRPAG